LGQNLIEITEGGRQKTKKQKSKSKKLATDYYQKGGQGGAHQ
jgi:hypothetical protein